MCVCYNSQTKSVCKETGLGIGTKRDIHRPWVCVTACHLAARACRDIEKSVKGRNVLTNLPWCLRLRRFLQGTACNCQSLWDCRSRPANATQGSGLGGRTPAHTFPAAARAPQGMRVEQQITMRQNRGTRTHLAPALLCGGCTLLAGRHLCIQQMIGWEGVRTDRVRDGCL